MAERVTEYIENEVQGVDLSDKLIQNRNQVVNCTGLHDHEYRQFNDELRGTRLVEFEDYGHFPFPRQLAAQLDKSQSNIAMGMFSEIGRAWMSIDSDLFFWNFTSNDDVVYFDGITETIIKVELVRPKGAIVDPSIHFIVVVVTSAEVLLLGMTFRGDDNMFTVPRNFDVDYVNTDIMIVNEPLFTTPLDVKSVQYITGTYDGRIFLAGQDSLVEISYHAGTWLRSKGIEKINHSKTIFSAILPGMPFFKTSEDIVQIEVDDTRHFLYTLGERGTVALYDMSEDGSQLGKVKSLTLSEIQKEIRNSCGVEDDYLAAIVYIRAIPSTESNFVVLEAVTSKALRIHFTAYYEAFQHPVVHPAQARAQTLRVMHVRYPPNDLFGIHRGAQIYTANGDSESLFVGQLAENECFLTVFSTSNFKFVEYPVENISNALLGGSVWAFARQPALKKPFTHPNAPFLHPLEAPWVVQQHDSAVRKIFVLTSNGTYIFQQNLPIQLFRKIMEIDSPRHFKWLVEQHGPVEICVMALAVICSNEPSDIAISQNATRAFFESGGVAQVTIGPDSSFQQTSIANLSQLQTPPRYTSTPTKTIGSRLANSFIDPNDADIGESPVFEHIAPSARHDALYIYFARIVSPLWGMRVATRQGNHALNGLPLNLVPKVIDQVAALLAAIERHNLIDFNSTGQIYDPLTAKAAEQEVQSLTVLKETATQTYEILRLWRILDEHQFHVITQLLDDQALTALTSMSLANVVGSAREVSSELVTCIIKYYIGDEATTEIISTRLSEECPMLFTVQDAHLLKASEFITAARRMPSGHEQAKTIHKAVSIIHQCIQRVNMDLVSSMLGQVHAYDYIAELALVRASKEDPMNLAVIAYRENVDNYEPRVRDAINGRTAAYKYVGDTLDHLQSRISGGAGDGQDGEVTPALAAMYRDEVINKVLESDDELAHVNLFKWLLKNNLEDVLFTKPQRYLENFLLHELRSGESTKYLELLWKYYEKNGNFGNAAELLYNFAESAKAIPLKKRVLYLSHAILCIQSGTENNANLALKQDIKARCDVAHIQQMIYDDLVNEGKSPSAVADLDTKLYNLTELYDNFAHPFQLAKTKLAILKCANYGDPGDIQEVWAEILAHDLAAFKATPPESAVQVQQRLVVTLTKLYTMYKASVEYVPLHFILRELLVKSFGGVPPSWVPQICKESGIPLAAALDVASNEFQNDRFWRTGARLTYMVGFVKYVCDQVLGGRLALSYTERAVLAEKILTFIGTLILSVEPQPGRAVNPLVGELKVYEEQIKNIV
uniref:Nucleoporin_N domain-containing protein n=1 Tax=Panagrellus redivivus TaxID=6233 RepID=A0A7E4UUJ1_PANRE